MPIFHDWCLSQFGFGVDGYELDKDLVFKGNKIYSENTCYFIPRRINTLILNRDNDRGLQPLGVTFDKKSGRFIAGMSDGSGRFLTIGSFSNPQDAFLAYKEAKENFIVEIAKQYRGLIHEDVYHALLGYRVEISD